MRWSMYASHSCPSLSVFLPLWGLHVIFSISGLQARKHIHILHLHSSHSPTPLLGWLWDWLHMGFRWVQIGYSVLVLGGFHKKDWMFLFGCLFIHGFLVGLHCNTTCSISHHIQEKAKAPFQAYVHWILKIAFKGRHQRKHIRHLDYVVCIE